MVNVEFEEEQFVPRSRPSSENKGMTAWLVKKGLAKNEKTANLILIGLIVVLCLIAYISISKDNQDNINTSPTFDAV